MHPKAHEVSSWNPPGQAKGESSKFAPHPFTVQAKHRPPAQEEIESEAFSRHKFEALGLQLKEKHDTITPLEKERLSVLQAKMDGFWAQRMERAKAQPNLLEIPIRNARTTQQPNETGLPDTLKTGVENLSGYSLDDVRVRYNSPKPARLKALAYTRGTEIHVAPRQEEHLPHEAWHVVQQMQGRVKPTMRMKDGLPVNDGDALEHEADVMGVQALANAAQRQGAPSLVPMQSAPAKASSHQVVQRTSYMRALNGDDRVATEVESLRRVFLNETNRQHQVNTWVDGFAGMPTARFTIADRQYYSPVGYKLETETETDVLANYRGDGNTNDIPLTHPHWVDAAQALRAAVIQVEDYTNWVEADFDELLLPEVDQQTPDGIRASYVNYFLGSYLQSDNPEDPIASQARNEGKIAVRNAIKTSGINALRDHYDNTGVEDRRLGPGLNPPGMAAAIADPNVPYIESILHAKFNQVTAAWYNRAPGDYAEAAAQPNWRGLDPNWLANRRTSAEAVRDAFNNAGANIQVEAIGPEPEEQ